MSEPLLPKVLSLIAPMTQLNTPYPSTAYLTGFLRSRGFDAVQEDLALALVLELFSADGFKAVRDRIAELPEPQRTMRVVAFDEQFDRYVSTIGPTLAFLQGRDATLAHRICSRAFLPEGPRFESLDVYIDDDGGDPLAWAFGALGVHDRARHLATLYLNDIADVLREAVDAISSTSMRHEFRLTMPESFPEAAIDEKLAVHIVTNLLSNAVKYSPAGGPVDVSARAAGRLLPAP
jgi:hypothetical protein